MRTHIGIFILFSFLLCFVSSRPSRHDANELTAGGINVCSRTFTESTIVYEEKHYPVKFNITGPKSKMYVQSRLEMKKFTSYFCCSGWERRERSKDCPQAICNPRCVEGSCVKPNQCECKKGFTGKYCEKEINECLQSPCEQTCTNYRGDYACSCKRGFRKVINSTIGKLHSPKCEDIDECKRNYGNYPELCRCVISDGICQATCLNTIGSYKCQCSPGFRLVANSLCVEIDECRENLHSCDQICLNRRGGYSCGCHPGYKLASDGKTCSDINECKYGNGGCDHYCTNTDGSFKCSCRSGSILLGNQFRCREIDECQISRPCDKFNGICTNNPGGYECSCKPGYELQKDGRTCNDINECSLGINDCEQNCYNIIGSYTCGCKSGFTKNRDRSTCTDIDECSLGVSGCEQICKNLPGTYRCKCRTGFLLLADEMSCAQLAKPLIWTG